MKEEIAKLWLEYKEWLRSQINYSDRGHDSPANETFGDFMNWLSKK